jgi:peptide/nickel transport system substrate-binding protein
MVAAAALIAIAWRRIDAPRLPGVRLGVALQGSRNEKRGTGNVRPLINDSSKRSGRKLALLAACGMALSVIGAGSSFAQQDMLRIRLDADIRTTEPGTNRDANTDAVILHMVEGLVAFREDGSVGPLLAKSYEVSEDGKQYTFTLRDGIKFHNGASLTSEDVALSMKRYLDPATKWRCLPEFQGGVAKIEAIETPDPKTVVFRLDRPTVLFLGTLARPDCGGTGITHRDSVNADGSWKTAIGTGPFKLVEWRHGQYIELAKFDDYKSLEGERDGHTGAKIVSVPHVRFMVIPDSSAARAALLAGQIDIADGLSAADLPTLQGRSDITVEMAPTMALIAIVFRSDAAVVKDPRVRQALALAIDREQLTEAVRPGTPAAPNASPIPVVSPFYSKVQAGHQGRDLEKARALLAEAGYKGEPIVMHTTQSYSELYDSAIIAQAMAAEAGINIQIQVIEWADEVQRFMGADYAAMSFSFSARLDPSLNFEMFAGPQPRKIWNTPEAMELLNKSMTEADTAARQKIFDELFELMVKDAPMVPLFNDTAITAVRSNISGYKNWLTGHPRLWGIQRN